MKEPTYYVQFSSPADDSSRWHTIARVEGKALAEEMVRLVEGSYGRTTVTYHYSGRDYRLTDVYGKVVRGILA